MMLLLMESGKSNNVPSLALLIRNILMFMKIYLMKYKKRILLKGYMSVFSILLKLRFNRIVNNFI